MDLKPEQRLEMLKLEMELIQGVFDKYDAMIFQSRSWFVTIWMATLGLAFTIRLPVLMLMAGALAVLYWVLEGLMRHQYWYQYVIRYRALRDAFNGDSARIEGYGTPKPSRWRSSGHPLAHSNRVRCTQFLAPPPSLSGGW